MTDQKHKAAPLPEWMRDMIAAEPRGFMQDIVQASRHRSQSASPIPGRTRPDEDDPPAKGTGWSAAVPLKPPPGIEIVDRLCIEQDKRDRAAMVKVKLETALIEAELEQAKAPRIETEWDPFDREHLNK